MDGAGEIVVPFHRGALAGQDRRGDAELRAPIGMGHAVGRGQRDGGHRPPCLSALGIGDPGNGQRRLFGAGRPIDQGFGGRFARVVHVQIGYLAGQQIFRIGEAAIGILGNRAGHGDGPFAQFAEAALGQIGRGDDGLALADEDPEADVGAFRAFQVFGVAEPPGDGERGAGNQDRVRRVGARRPGLGDQIVEPLKVVFLLCHGFLTGQRCRGFVGDVSP